MDKATNTKTALNFRVPNKKGRRIENIPLKKLIYTSFSINIFVILLILLFKKTLPPVVPLYYGLVKSEAQLVKQTYLIIPSVFSLFIIFFNIFFSIFTDNNYLKKSLIVAAFVVTILSAITTIKITLLVASI